MTNILWVKIVTLKIILYENYIYWQNTCIVTLLYFFFLCSCNFLKIEKTHFKYFMNLSFLNLLNFYIFYIFYIFPIEFLLFIFLYYLLSCLLNLKVT